MIGCICASPSSNKLVSFRKEFLPECKTYVEIGVLYGGSIIEQMKEEEKCLYVGIDPFTGYYGRSFDPHRGVDLSDHIGVVKKNLDTNNPHNHDYLLIKGKSDDVVNQCPDNIDYLFIDGDHSKEGVMKDFKNYQKKVSPKGIIVFDNYNDKSWEGVTEGVDEILPQYPEWETIKVIGCSLIARKI
jgi:hypothetical protein